MKTYISDIIPRIQKFSQKLDNLTLLTNQHWVVIDDIDKTKNVYIFRQNNELLISQNGKVEKAKWEYLGHNSLLIDRKDESYLFRHGFFDENILALKIDSKDEYAFLVNETKFDKELNSSLSVIEFLSRKYIEPTIKRDIQNQTGLSIDKTNELNAYTIPSYCLRKIARNTSFFGVFTEQYLVEFEDGICGKFFLEDNRRAFFKAKPNEYWLNVRCIYEDIDKCVNALHYFLKNNEVLKTDGFIAIY